LARSLSAVAQRVFLKVATFRRGPVEAGQHSWSGAMGMK